MNIEGYGLHSSIVQFLGAFSSAGELYGVIHKFSNTIGLIDTAGECAEIFAAYVDTAKGVAGVRGTEEVVQKLPPLLETYQIIATEKSYSMQLCQPAVCDPEKRHLARKAVPEDLDMLTTLYARADRMYRSRTQIANRLGKECIYVVEEPQTESTPARIASCAMVNVTGAGSALVGGVFTLPEARGKGYAMACTYALSQDIQSAGLLPCLFFENPVAGRIYKRIGYEVVDTWELLFLSAKPLSERGKR
jgi:predicted GNAT family acetyltransferase